MTFTKAKKLTSEEIQTLISQNAEIVAGPGPNSVEKRMAENIIEILSAELKWRSWK